MDMDMERTMKFLLEQQARFAAQLEKVVAKFG